MTLKDLRLCFSKRPYLQRSIEMVTRVELLKLKHIFFPRQAYENQDSKGDLVIRDGSDGLSFAYLMA